MKKILGVIAVLAIAVAATFAFTHNANKVEETCKELNGVWVCD